MSDGNIRFMSNNFLESSLTYSSQLSAQFAGANAAVASRSKIWRFGGNFTIDATNNKIYINDGTDKTITLTSASYTYATLATHIQTQLNASSSLWTCTYSSVTFKFTLSRSAGTDTLRLSVTTAAAWDTLGYVGAIDRAASVADEQRNHTSEWVKCDLGIGQVATFAAVLCPIDEVLSLSATASVKVQANNVDSWDTPPVDETITIGSIAAMKFLANTDEYRYWRCVITDRLNVLGPEAIDIACIYIGDDTQPTSRNIAPGFSQNLVDPSNVLLSENGAMFFETKPRYLEINACTVQLLSGVDQRAIQQLFYDLGIRTPFYVSFDPNLQISESLEELTRYMVMSSAPSIEHVFRSYYNISFAMREAF